MQIVSKSNRSLTLDLVHREESIKSTRSQNLGELTVHAEELSSSKIAMEIIFRCSDLEYKDLFSRSVWTCWIIILFLFAIFFSLLSIMRNAIYELVYVLGYLAGPLSSNIKDCRGWDLYPNLQDRSRKE